MRNCKINKRSLTLQSSRRELQIICQSLIVPQINLSISSLDSNVPPSSSPGVAVVTDGSRRSALHGGLIIFLDRADRLARTHRSVATQLPRTFDVMLRPLLLLCWAATIVSGNGVPQRSSRSRSRRATQPAGRARKRNYRAMMSAIPIIVIIITVDLAISSRQEGRGNGKGDLAIPKS